MNKGALSDDSVKTHENPLVSLDVGCARPTMGTAVYDEESPPSSKTAKYRRQAHAEVNKN